MFSSRNLQKPGFSGTAQGLGICWTYMALRPVMLTGRDNVRGLGGTAIYVVPRGHGASSTIAATRRHRPMLDLP